MNLTEQIQELEGLIKTSKTMDKLVLKNCLLLLNVVHNLKMPIDNFRFNGLMTGGLQMEWIFNGHSDFSGDRKVILAYYAKDEVRITFNTLDTKAAKVLELLFAFFEQLKKDERDKIAKEQTEKEKLEKEKAAARGTISDMDAAFF